MIINLRLQITQILLKTPTVSCCIRTNIGLYKEGRVHERRRGTDYDNDK